MDLGLLMFRFRQFHDKLAKIVDAELRKMGITYSQFTLLKYLEDKKGEEVSIKDIANIIGIRHSTVIGIVARLAAKGYVTSHISEKDKRVRLVSVTETRFDFEKCEAKVHEKVFSEMKANFSDEEFEDIRCLMNTFINEGRNFK